MLNVFVAIMLGSNMSIIWLLFNATQSINKLHKDLYQLRIDTANELNNIVEQQNTLQHEIQNNSFTDRDEDSDWWKRGS